MKLFRIGFLVGNRVGQIGRLVTHLFQIGVIHIEDPGVVLVGFLFVDLALGPFEPLFAEILQTRVAILHQHGIDQYVGIDNPLGIVVETDAVVGLERSAHAVYS